MEAYILILGYDCESTGLDVKTDQIIEVGAVLWETEERVPLKVFNAFIRPRSALPAGYVSPTGIKIEWLNQHGISFPEAMGEIQRMVAAMPEPIVVAHNGCNFDKPITESNLEADKIRDHGIMSAHWVDTRLDLPLLEEPSSRKLVYMAADHGFLNPYPHRAVFDVMAMLKLMGHYNFEEVLALSKIPMIRIRALTNFDQKQLAKDARFLWDGEKKIWHKEIRLNAFDREFAAAAEKGFAVVRL